jgi:hypothetical protein
MKLNIQMVAAPTDNEREFCELVDELQASERTLDDVERYCQFARHLRNFTPERLSPTQVGIKAKMVSRDAGKLLAVVTTEPAGVVAVLVLALNHIAAWGQGLEVTGSFDEPAAATCAREALAKVGITKGE